MGMIGGWALAVVVQGCYLLIKFDSRDRLPSGTATVDECLSASYFYFEFSLRSFIMLVMVQLTARDMECDIESNEYCPMARAITRLLKSGHSVSMGGCSYSIYRGKPYTETVYRNTVDYWSQLYDAQENNLAPPSFELEIPEEYLNERAIQKFSK